MKKEDYTELLDPKYDTPASFVPPTTTPSSNQGLITSTAKDIGRGITGFLGEDIAGFIAGADALVDQYIIDEPKDDPDNFDLKTFMRGVQKSSKEFKDELIPESKRTAWHQGVESVSRSMSLKAPAWIAGTVAGAKLGMGAGFLGGGPIGAFVGTVGGGIAGLLTGDVLYGLNQYNDAKQKYTKMFTEMGNDPDTANTKAEIPSLLEAGSEMFTEMGSDVIAGSLMAPGLSTVGKALATATLREALTAGLVKQSFKRGLVTMFSETSMEMSNSIFQTAVEDIYGKDKDLTDVMHDPGFWDKQVENLGPTAVASAIFSVFAMGGHIHLQNKVKNNLENPAAKKENRELAADLVANDIAKEDKMLAKVWRGFVQKHMIETGEAVPMDTEMATLRDIVAEQNVDPIAEEARNFINGEPESEYQDWEEPLITEEEVNAFQQTEDKTTLARMMEEDDIELNREIGRLKGKDSDVAKRRLKVLMKQRGDVAASQEAQVAVARQQELDRIELEEDEAAREEAYQKDIARSEEGVKTARRRGKAEDPVEAAKRKSRAELAAEVLKNAPIIPENKELRDSMGVLLKEQLAVDEEVAGKEETQITPETKSSRIKDSAETFTGAVADIQSEKGRVGLAKKLADEETKTPLDTLYEKLRTEDPQDLLDEAADIEDVDVRKQAIRLLNKAQNHPALQKIKAALKDNAAPETLTDDVAEIEDVDVRKLAMRLVTKKETLSQEEAWERSDLATSPNIPDSRVTVKKQSDGNYKLLFTGTSNEVFEGEIFKSAREARDFFKVQKIKAQGEQDGNRQAEEVTETVEKEEVGTKVKEGKEVSAEKTKPPKVTVKPEQTQEVTLDQNKPNHPIEKSTPKTEKPSHPDENIYTITQDPGVKPTITNQKNKMLGAVDEAIAKRPESNKDKITERQVGRDYHLSTSEDNYVDIEKNNDGQWEVIGENEDLNKIGLSLKEAKEYARALLRNEATPQGEVTFTDGNYTLVIPNSVYHLNKFRKKVKSSTGVRFSRTKTPTTKPGATVKMVQAKVEQSLKHLKMDNAPPIHVVQSTSDLSKEQLRRLGESGEVKAFYDTESQEVVIIADNISNSAEAHTLVLHEVAGHHGIRGVLGKRLDSVLDEVFTHFGKDEFGKIAEDYELDLSTKEGQRTAAEEMLASSQEYDQKHQKFIKRIYAQIRDLLRRIGVVQKMTDNDIALLLSKSMKFAQKGKGRYKGRTAFSKDKGDTGDAIGFYSALSRAANNVKNNKMPAKTWIKQLMNQPNVKKAEIEATGLDDWLAMQEGSVTKEAVQNFLDQNGVQVEEVVKGDYSEATKLRLDEIDTEHNNLTNEFDSLSAEADRIENDGAKGDIEEINYRLGEIRKEITTLDEERDALTSDSKDPTKFSEYQLSDDKTNYREVLLTLPGEEKLPLKLPIEKGVWVKDGKGVLTRENSNIRIEEKDGGFFVSDKEAQRYRLYYVLDYAKEAGDEFFAEKHGKPTYKEQKQQPIFKSPHWDEPNVLAHIRTNDRIIDGEKVLFIEEIQSDWNLEGRKKGFETREDKKKELIRKLGSGEITRQEYNQARGALMGTEDGTPKAPFVQDASWQNLVMKRIMRMAAEGGYDRVAFVNGKQTADRYSLDKKLDSLSYEFDKKKGTYTFSGEQNGRDIFKKTDVAPADLETFIGKEIANRISKKQGLVIDNDIELSGTLTGKDLKIEAKWARELYDVAVPNWLKNYGKKHDSKTQIIDVGTGQKQVSLPVTEKLRNDVMGGQPMFKKEKVRFSRKSKRKKVPTIGKSLFPKTREKVEANRGRKKETIKEKFTDFAIDFKNMSLKHFTDLDYKNHGEAGDYFRVYESSDEFAKAAADQQVMKYVKDMKPEEYDVFRQLMAFRDIKMQITKDKAKAPEDRKMDLTKPLAFHENEQELDADIAHFESQITPEIKKSIDNRTKFMRDLRATAIKVGTLDEQFRDDDNYFHREVLQYMNDNPKTGVSPGGMVRKQKSRTGASSPFNTEFVEAEYAVVARMVQNIKAKEVLNRTKSDFDVSKAARKRMKDQNLSQKEVIPVDENGNPTHTWWTPDENSGWHKILTITESQIKKLTDGITLPENIKTGEGLVKGQTEEWLIPTDIAKTLDQLKEFKQEDLLSRIGETTLNRWKQWILLNPYRFFKYNVNNTSGDLDITFAAYPDIITKYAHQAMKDLITDFKGKASPELEAELLNTLEHAVTATGMTASDIPDVSEQMRMNKHLDALIPGDSKFGIKAATGKLRNSWLLAKDLSTLRENVLRLAAFRYFKDNFAEGRTQVAGVSKRQELNQLKVSDEKAARLARDLLGDYGNLTQTSEWLRRKMIPFWSWQSINAPRYYRLFRNMRHDELQTGKKGEVRALGTISWKAGKMAIRTAMLFAMVNAWNASMFPEEEEELGESGRKQLHLILGRRDDGSIISVRFQGALSDALGWFALEDIDNDLIRLVKGKDTLADKVNDAINAPLTRLYQGSRPLLKTAVEAGLGVSTYPEFTSPRPVRDKVRHILRTFSLDKIYDQLAGKPIAGGNHMEQLGKDLMNVFAYSTDPGITAYYDTRKLASDFMEKETGQERPTVVPTSKSNALYYYKQALRFGDVKAAEKYLKKYYDLGGKRSGIKISLKAIHPLGGVPKRYRTKFKKSMDKGEKYRYEKALEFYKKAYFTKR